MVTRGAGGREEGEGESDTEIVVFFRMGALYSSGQLSRMYSDGEAMAWSRLAAGRGITFEKWAPLESSAAASSDCRGALART